METEPMRKGRRVPPTPSLRPDSSEEHRNHSEDLDDISNALQTVSSRSSRVEVSMTYRDDFGEVSMGSLGRRVWDVADEHCRRARASSRWPRTHPRIGGWQACRTSSTRTCAPTWCVQHSKNPIARPRRLANRCTTVRRSGRKARWTSKVRAMETNARRERFLTNVFGMERRKTTRGAKVEKKRRRSVRWKNKERKTDVPPGFCSTAVAKPKQVEK